MDRSWGWEQNQVSDSPPRERQQVSALGSSQSSSPAKLTLDTSGPNLIVPSLHRFRMQVSVAQLG